VIFDSSVLKIKMNIERVESVVSNHSRLANNPMTLTSPNPMVQQSSTPPTQRHRLSCDEFGCDKTFPSKYTLKRHRRCHLKRPSPSADESLNVIGKMTKGQKAKPPSQNEATSMVEVKSGRQDDRIPPKLRDLGIDSDWLLEPRPLQHGQAVTVEHSHLLSLLMARFDFTWPRMSKWLQALGVDPAQALVNVITKEGDAKSEVERQKFFSQPLVGDWLNENEKFQSRPRNSIEQQPDKTSDWPITSQQKALSEAVNSFEGSVETSKGEEESLPDEAMSLASEQSDVAAINVLQSQVVSSESSPDCNETVEDIPLPIEKISDIDPEILSQISLPKPIALHDIPLPALSTIPLPAEK